jgi:hypothetical protein
VSDETSTSKRKKSNNNNQKFIDEEFLKKRTIRPNQSLLAFDSFASIKKQREKQGERERERERERYNNEDCIQQYQLG